MLKFAVEYVMVFVVSLTLSIGAVLMVKKEIQPYWDKIQTTFEVLK